MAQVIAPLFSLSASGLMGKALFFYDTKYGARVRSPKKTFVPPGNIWEVNKAWFQMASDRFKNDLTQEQKWAWKLAYVSDCDTYRDIFMGVQIQYWNLSPENMITWPLVGVPDIGNITFNAYESLSEVHCSFKDFNKILIEKYCPCTLWACKIGDDLPPTEAEIDLKRQKYSATLLLWPGAVNYLWGGVRYLDGTKKMFFIGSYDRT
jgi:hypothetical protein